MHIYRGFEYFFFPVYQVAAQRLLDLFIARPEPKGIIVSSARKRTVQLWEWFFVNLNEWEGTRRSGQVRHLGTWLLGNLCWRNSTLKPSEWSPGERFLGRGATRQGALSGQAWLTLLPIARLTAQGLTAALSTLNNTCMRFKAPCWEVVGRQKRGASLPVAVI